MLNKKCRKCSSSVISLAVLFLLLMAVVPTYGELVFQGPFGIAIKPDGSFYVAEIQDKRIEHADTSGSIAKFDRHGNYIGRLKEIAGYGKLKGPYDINVGESGDLYIADTWGHCILILDQAENLKLQIGTGTPSTDPGGFLFPHTVVADEEKQVLYVADGWNYRMQILDMQGMPLKVLGKQGRAKPNTYHFATGIDFDDAGNVYGISNYGGIINVYDAQWEFVRMISRPGYAPGELNSAYSLRCYQDTIWVADGGNNRLQQFSKDGKLLKIIGGKEGSGIGQFNNPSAVDFDAQGNIYVVDFKNDRVVKLDPQGNFVRQWGKPAAVDLGYVPPKMYQRDACRGPVIMAVYGDITKSQVDAAAGAGIDGIYASPGYDNRSGSKDRTSGEWEIKEQVDYAHEQGVKVEVSVAVFKMGAESPMWKKRPEFYMWEKGEKGRDRPTNLGLSYFFPEVRSWKAKHIAEQVKKSGVDGVMLDYIRYPNYLVGYEPAMVEAFKKETGKDPAIIAPDDWDWLKFRAKYITMFICELRRELVQLDWPVELSIYIDCPNWEKDVKARLRDWRDWVRMGILDKISLGVYSRSFPAIYEGIRQVREVCPDHVKVGIMVASWGGNLNNPELLKKAAEVSFAADVDEFSNFRGASIERLQLWEATGEISKKFKVLNYQKETPEPAGSKIKR